MACRVSGPVWASLKHVRHGSWGIDRIGAVALLCFRWARSTCLRRGVADSHAQPRGVVEAVSDAPANRAASSKTSDVRAFYFQKTPTPLVLGHSQGYASINPRYWPPAEPRDAYEWGSGVTYDSPLGQGVGRGISRAVPQAPE